MTTIIWHRSLSGAFIASDTRISAGWEYNDNISKSCIVNWVMFAIAWYHIPIDIFIWIAQNIYSDNLNMYWREHFLRLCKELPKILWFKDWEADILAIWSNFTYLYTNAQVSSYDVNESVFIWSWAQYAKALSIWKINKTKLDTLFKNVSKMDLFTSPNYELINI
jgi:hypothetical protein